jgi:acyl transferase domain-containing protein/NAD(P)H-dependent flavin oxidoreductase YrpB (nitropropane dioxygenase family)/NAD(P)-dependent dehydrogenase (short-subunit alcohol dehydrogenase family)
MVGPEFTPPMTPPLCRVLALAPPGLDSTSFVVAAGRAGALGILDPALCGDPSDPVGLARVARFASCPFALKVETSVISSQWLTSLPQEVGVLVCEQENAADWEVAFSLVQRSGRLVLAEVISREGAAEAVKAGVDGLIVAGHEAGGGCSEESSFILAQAILENAGVPVWVRGGIGRYSAASCVAMGAAGVVLDGALLLARESPLEESVRDALARFDGAGTAVIGPLRGPRIRVFAPAKSPVLDRLRSAAVEGRTDWRSVLKANVGWSPDQAWPVGQDAAFASDLARRHVTVGGIIQAVEDAIDRALESSATLRPLAPGSPLALSHGTTYPIVQGPMTRVSDTTTFAQAVSDGGGLPFLALAMLRSDAVRELLAQTAARMAGRPYGVGVLGFVSPELRIEQVEAIREARPPFALIAGGRPDQARDLESCGIATYLHVPSPGLLVQFLKDGARRFVLEGRECGGHVGPRSSLVLWDQAVGVLLAGIEKGIPAESLHVLFAGGVHDARSAAAVSMLAVPLAERGVKIGALIGTAYLFTKEIVNSGAVVRRFQDEAVRCTRTVLLETGPGHEVRVGPSPFVDVFGAERRRLVSQGRAGDSVREELERLNAGRLRVAAKGVDRANGAETPLVAVSESDQFERGVYMLGQVATLRNRVTTIAELHRDISERGSVWLDRFKILSKGLPKKSPPSDIAIVGMAAHFPGASDLQTFWENTLRSVDAITEVPRDRWDWRTYYDPDPKAPDKIVSKWGGFLPDVAFDPLRYGMPPSSLPSIEPAQLLVLEATRAALDDAGYAERPFPRERTAVVLGMGGGAAQLAMGYAFRSYLPMLEAIAPEAGRQAYERAKALLPEWTEDSFPGFLLNVTAGRVANRFDLGGANYTVDAACGSSLAAAVLAVRELETGAADLVVLGGADTVQNPFTYLAFSKTQAFSPRGRCRPFDASADGIVISEGVGVLILKRLADAERDGDRIYAVIKGLGASSDGRERGLTAPSADGQTRALQRAYEKSGIDPKTVGYFEAHGTGTALGDVVEVNALSATLRQAGAAPSSCAVGSIKSLIGHTKCAAGLAGLINASLALYHQVFPPTIGVQTLNPKADLIDGPLRVSTKLRPWLHSETTRPRRAGVSAFGFGGTNFHAVLEAYDRDPTPVPAPVRDWPAELLVWRHEARACLSLDVKRVSDALQAGAQPGLRELAHSLAVRAERVTGGPVLAIVASSLEDLRAKLESARALLETSRTEKSDPAGLYFSDRPPFVGQPLAMLFPGQGSQSLEMVGDLALVFPEIRSGFETIDAALLAAGLSPVTPKIFPPTTLDDSGRDQARQTLMQTDVAQPAVGAASLGMFRLLDALGVRPDLAAGHSYGELVALHAAGVMPAESLATLSEARGRLMREAAGAEPGRMVAVAAGPQQIESLLVGSPKVVVANFNGPNQTVLAGPRDDLTRVVERARTDGLRAVELAVSCAFHSPSVAGARDPFIHIASKHVRCSPRIPVYANWDAAPHPSDADAIARRLGDHLASPVQFQAMIEAMYDAGARVFVEVGPGSVCASFVASILVDRPHVAVACDAAGRPGLPTLLHAMARLIVAGVPVRLSRLTSDRHPRRLDLDNLSTAGAASPPASTWFVNGSRSRPIHQPEPKRFGQAMAIEENSRDHPHHDSAPTSDGDEAVQGSARNGFHEASRVMASAPIPTDNGAAGRSRPAMVAPARSGAGFSGVDGQSGRGSTTGLGSEDPGIDVDRSATPSPILAPTAVNHSNARPSRHSDGKATSPESSPVSDRVIEAFQETMRAFLDVQQSTMLAYLSRISVDQRHVPVPTPSRLSEQLAGKEPANPIERSEAVNMSSAPLKPVANPSASNAAVPQPAPRKTSEAKPEADRETISSRLIEIVRERTGYPAEILKRDLDLEADLGIDSIKRVEILGTLRDSVPGLETSADSSLMDGLTRARTLGEIVERVEASLQAGRLPTTPAVVAITGPAALASTPVIRRLLLESIHAPLGGSETGLAPGAVLLVTDDGRGVARSIAQSFRADGHRVHVVGSDAEPLDLSSPSAVDELLRRVRKTGPVAGIIHALPLRDTRSAGLDARAWSARMGVEVKGLFLLARAAADDLERASRRGGACLVSATAMGGNFASTRDIEADFFPGQGGISGLVKTLAREWPNIRTRVVDFNPRTSLESIAACLAREARTDDGWAEVGYDRGRRFRLSTKPTPLTPSGDELALKAGEPLLVTGGARGITGAVAVELARRYQPTLLLIGSSPLPTEAEAPETAGLVAAAELKSSLLARLRRNGQTIGPGEIDAAYKSLIKSREIRSTLARAREAGAQVEYARTDVRDAERLARTLDAWKRRYGDLAGLIHGAGVIHDKLLRDKKPESFDHVLSTKLDGTLNLARLVRPDSFKFAALFSSVAGRFGNQGQSDYAAANEALNKLAVWLDRRWPGRVVSMIWGPWSGVGMVSDLEGHLGRRGLGIIPPEIGCSGFVDELRWGRKGEVEVILSGELGSLETPLRSELETVR